MSFERVYWQQQWARHRTYFMDWGAILLLLVVFSPWRISSIFFYGGIVFAAGLGVRFGGYNTATGTWEFMLTRSFSRKRLLRAQTLAAFLPLVLFNAIFVIADRFDLRSVIAGLFIPSSGREPHAFDSASALRYASTFAVTTFFMLHVFAKALKHDSVASLDGLRIAGIITGMIWLAVLNSAMGFLLYVVRSADAPWHGDLPRLLVNEAQNGALATLLAAAGLCFVHLRWMDALMADREVAGDGVARLRPVRVASGMGLLIAAVIVVVMLGAVAFVFLAASHTPEPSFILPVVPR